MRPKHLYSHKVGSTTISGSYQDNIQGIYSPIFLLEIFQLLPKSIDPYLLEIEKVCTPGSRVVTVKIYTKLIVSQFLEMCVLMEAQGYCEIPLKKIN